MYCVFSYVDPFDIPDSDESGDEHEHYNPNRRVGELPSSRYMLLWLLDCTIG